MKKIIRLTESDLARIVKRVMLQEAIAIYVVKPGDTLTKIAKMNNITVSDILKMNPQIKDANKIYPGDEITIIDTPPVTPDIPTSMDVDDCIDIMGLREDDGTIGGSDYNPLEITGEVELSYNATVSPGSRSMTIIKDGKPFCKIPVYSTIGDCEDEMEVTSDAPGSPMKASLDSPVRLNTTGQVAPQNRGMIIRDAGGYFCKVPTGIGQFIPESRRRRGYRY